MQSLHQPPVGLNNFFFAGAKCHPEDFHCFIAGHTRAVECAVSPGLSVGLPSPLISKSLFEIRFEHNTRLMIFGSTLPKEV